MATQTEELEPDAFWYMVTKDKLQVSGPSAGYMWTGRQGVRGWEVYKTRAQPIGWLYQGRRTNTQTAGGGGALSTKISVPSGVTAKLIAYEAIGAASAGATLIVRLLDEDSNAVSYLADIAAGASRLVNLPSIGQAANANNNLTDSLGLIIGPGQTINVTTSAALQTETLIVSVVLLMSAAVEPTWSTAGSAGTPSLGATSISPENTLQAVYL